ncbi:MAG: VWA domain-containing protein [Gammaproteobacteria bacterium]|nr:VWA domain-containing protein [Gammaproteobacteria bacterium]
MKSMGKIALAIIIALAIQGCTSKKNHSRGVYMLVDTSGTYATQMTRAGKVVNYLLGTLNPGDTFAVARVKSRSFTEKDIIAKATFDATPSRMNAQKKEFRDRFQQFAKNLKKGSAHTDITGGVIQGAEFLTEAGAGTKMILIFSDMQEELDDKTVRDFPISLDGIQFIALNVTKLKTDNMDPRRYLGRLANWEKRVMNAGASGWRVVNDMEQLDRIFKES